ncbi:MAG: S-methyl-5-thioribose-1-phosphate isomerase [Coriobacteriales bacterium]|jgi:methylthioribose-1-phosphate isomerase|nr:S-methyl-5-thioribose-1-phosphate isomerase [Coriobacteriales bacterium]
MPADMEKVPRSIWWGNNEENGKPGIFILDQTRLPLVGEVLCFQQLNGIELAIKSMAVRGAPALGVVAAMAVALWSENESLDTEVGPWLAGIDAVAERIGQARPTAINLSWGARRVRDYAHLLAESGAPLPALKLSIVALAQKIAMEDEACNRSIGAHGAELVNPGARIMTHCNAGSLATAYYGTVGAVIYTAFDQNKLEHVWVGETRPLNQGARLMSWELMAAGVPCALITDSMAASVMQSGWVNAIFVGADRICANGDVVNKIGTLSMAIAAKRFNIPFYVCAPNSTIDKTASDGSQVPIEQRDGRELAGFTVTGTIVPTDDTVSKAFDLLTESGEKLLRFKGKHKMNVYRRDGGYAFDAWFQTTPLNLPIYNPAFDVTPADLVTAIITETGVHKPADL